MSVMGRARFSAAVKLIQETNAGIVEGALGDSRFYTITDSAPNTYEDLICKFGAALLWGHRVPVGAEGLSGSIYNSNEDNAQFRAAHDLLHFRYSLPFTLEGETQAALLHCLSVAKHGEANNWAGATIRDAIAILWTDTAGQAEYFAETDGGFVTDQRGFVIPRFISYLISTAPHHDYPIQIGHLG